MTTGDGNPEGPAPALPRFEFEPIGFVRSPFVERVDAPRQAIVAADVEGQIELLPGRGYEDAVSDLEGWERVWVLFVFDRNVAQNRGWRPRVTPPRSGAKRGLFATRSPHRPNPIGLSAVTVVRVAGRVLHVRGVDMLDGTPVLDLKPYVPYADAFPAAASGWLSADPVTAWPVAFAEAAAAQLAWLAERSVTLREPIERALALGPEPHAYRRIRVHRDGRTLALKDWRVDFEVHGRSIVVVRIRTGYRPRDLAAREGLDVHRAFVAAFGGS